METITLTANDGFTLNGHLARPQGEALAGVVIFQEIFGVTGHIRRVVQGYADNGYLALAPSLFDRIEPGIALDYTEIEAGRAQVAKLDESALIADMRAAVEFASAVGKVGVVGYCWGGTLAWMAAGSLPVAAAVSYYGTRMIDMLDRTPGCPVQFHFGELDQSIPPAAIERVRKTCPHSPVYVYPEAEHGFNCDERSSFQAEASVLARQRSLAFLAEHLLGQHSNGDAGRER